MNATEIHDWASVLPKFVTYYNIKGQPDEPWAYTRPDGQVMTVVGSDCGMLVIDGQHLMTVPLAYKDSPEGYKKLNGAAVDKVFGQKAEPFDSPEGYKKLNGAAVDKVFGQKAEPFATDTVGRLRVFCGEPHLLEAKVVVDCPECHGAGEVECCACGHDHECDVCDGEGRVEEQTDALPRTVLVIDRSRFDRNIIAPLLAVLPEGSMEIGFRKRKTLRELVLTGNRWQIRVMNLINENP